MMTSLIKLERNFGDEELLFSLIDSKTGTFHIDVKGMSERVSYNLVNFPKSLSPQAADNSISLLQHAKVSLIDRNITVTPPNDNAQVWAVWLSVFPEGDQQVEGFQEKALRFLLDCSEDDFDLILQFASCCDQQVRNEALARAKLFPNMTLEMKAKLLDFYVDQHLCPESPDPPKETLSQKPDERFWTRYYIQAYKRMPSGEHPRPDGPREGLVDLISQVGGFTNAQIFEPINHVNYQKICTALACQPDGAKPWYEEIRIKRAWKQDVTDLIKQLSNDFHQRAQAPDYSIRQKCQEMAAERWNECADSMRFYIAGRAALSQNGEGKEILTQVEEFLESDARVMLIQGDSGSGKTSAAINIERALLARENIFIPHYIRLIYLGDQSLKDYLKETIGHAHKDQGKFLFLLGGYDEINCNRNLITQENLKEWKQSKFLITCRTQNLNEGYRNNFHFVNTLNRPIHSSLIELYMSPFNDEERKGYISKMTKTNKDLNFENFEKQLNNMPRLKEMASLPFVLVILTEVLPKLNENSLRCEVYEAFACKRFEDEKMRLNLQDGVEKEFFDFSSLLAYEMMIRKDQIIVLPTTSRLMRTFGGTSNTYTHLMQSDDAIICLARTGCMIRGLGNNRYEFLHPSLRDYFAAVRLMQLIQQNKWEDFGKIYLSSEPAVVNFLAEMLWTISDAERKLLFESLFTLINASKSVIVNDDVSDNSVHDTEAVIKASSNAATVLARAGISFSGKDLRCVKLINANLNGGIFHYTDLRGATLTGAELQRVQLVDTKLQGANLESVEFGEWATLFAGKKVCCIAYHPSRHQCAVGLRNGEIQLWETNEVVQLGSLIGHEGWVTSVCYSPDGERILSGSGDCTLRQWDSRGGKATHIFEGHEDWVTSVCYSPDGEHLLSGSGDCTVRQWDSRGGAATHIFQWHEGWVTSVCYSPDGMRLLSGSYDNTVRQWQSTGGDVTHVFRGHKNLVTSVCYSRDGERLLSGSGDCTVRQWNSRGGAATHIFQGHEDAVTCVCYSPDGERILSGSLDGTVRQWKSLGGRATQILKGHGGEVICLCFSTDGERLLSGSEDCTVRQWKSTGGDATHIFKEHFGQVTALCFSSDGKRLLSGSRDWNVCQWKSIGGGATHIFQGHEGWITSVCYSPDGERFLSASRDFTVRQWKSTGGDPSHILKGHENVVTSVCYSPDGKRLLTGSRDYTVRQWESTGGEVTHIFKGHLGLVTCACYSPDGSHILSGSCDYTILQWKSTGGESTHVFKGHDLEVTSVCYSPDGKNLLSGSNDKTVLQWQSSGGGATHIFNGHEDAVTSVCYSPDGRRVLSGSLDKTARLWDTNTTECFCVLKGHHSGIESVAWNVHNEIATASDDHTIAVWRKLPNTEDDHECWAMVWHSGFTAIFAFGCQIDDNTELSLSNRILLKQRSQKGDE